MATKFPNRYYKQLAEMIIQKPSLRLKSKEVCFFQGDAQAFETITETKKSLKRKHHFSSHRGSLESKEKKKLS